AMATAILRGAEAAGVLDPRATIVADPSQDARRAHERAGCATVASAGEVAARLTAGGAVMLAVKPQMLGAVAEDLRGAGADFTVRLVVSVLAGATSESVREAMPGSPRVVRVMPNTPAQIGRGISAIAPGA